MAWNLGKLWAVPRGTPLASLPIEGESDFTPLRNWKCLSEAVFEARCQRRWKNPHFAGLDFPSFCWLV